MKELPNRGVYIAFTTKGLEEVTRGEIKTLFPEAWIIETLTKRVIFSAPDVNVEEFFKLRTVDDIQLLLKHFEDVNGLSNEFIVENLPIERIRESRELISYFRELKQEFSLTVYKYKNDSVDLNSLKSELSNKLGEGLNLRFTEFNHTNYDVRVHVEEDDLFYSCRLPRVSLYKRVYEVDGVKGGLKPTIAASMCKLLNPVEDGKLVDNFCGSGTILIESYFQWLKPYGGDNIPKRVHIAKQCMNRVNPDFVDNIKVLNAKSTKWKDSCFDYAVSNLPWGKQVPVEHVVELYSEAIKEYARILKDDGKIILLGKKPDLIIKHLKKNFPNKSIKKFQIGFLGQNPWIVRAF